MFWEDNSEEEKQKHALASDFDELLKSLMNDYLSETKKHLPSLEKELLAAKKFDAFGNEITPEGKDEEVWSYFAEKNLWENIFNKNYKNKQAAYLNRLENFLSDTIYEPEKHIEQFGRGLLWRYSAKLSSPGDFSYEYEKTEDPLIPLSKTLKTFYTYLKEKEVPYDPLD